ncbi:MAG: hypothetical protein DI616_16715 [Paracoccus denitrificans]|uniref:Fe/B12 periplasmic-binding domain-containing protein n=1 Tax=Paracoccus denitrificans TaxID=266 RepID=A0A533I2M7_PARDE|nr:MAG: hypothetical protein DI616_16715 [Paracoccus denitrificans]
MQAATTFGTLLRPAGWLAGLMLVANAHMAQAEIILTDIAGREVRLDAPAKRIILEGPAYYPALALLHTDAADLIIAAGTTKARGEFQAERDLAGKPRLGTMVSNTFSVERALELQPDLMIATLEAPGQQSAVEAAFETAGVPIIYVDFFLDPVTNTVPSFKLIGQATGAEDRAADYIAFHQTRLDHIRDVIEEADVVAPRMLVHRQAIDGTCCWSFAQGFMSSFFDMLRIENIAQDKLPGVVGQLNLEAVIADDPQVIVATDMSLTPEALFRPGRKTDEIESDLRELTAEPGFAQMSAVRDGRVHGMDITLMRSPLNILAVELFAKWAHPDLFADLDPQATLDQINEQFLTTPLEPPLWASLPEE